MNSNAVAILLFMALCVLLVYVHSTAESEVTICQAGGHILIMKPRELRVLFPNIDLSVYECRTSRVMNQEIWDLRSAYRRAKGIR